MKEGRGSGRKPQPDGWIIEVGSENRPRRWRQWCGGGKNRQSALHEITMFNENCGWRSALHEANPGRHPGRWPSIRSGRVVASCSHGRWPNRDAAKRYSDCTLSGFADFFSPRQKGNFCNQWSGDQSLCLKCVRFFPFSFFLFLFYPS